MSRSRANVTEHKAGNATNHDTADVIFFERVEDIAISGWSISAHISSADYVARLLQPNVGDTIHQSPQTNEIGSCHIQSRREISYFDLRVFLLPLLSHSVQICPLRRLRQVADQTVTDYGTPRGRFPSRLTHAKTLAFSPPPPSLKELLHVLVSKSESYAKILA